MILKIKNKLNSIPELKNKDVKDSCRKNEYSRMISVFCNSFPDGDISIKIDRIKDWENAEINYEIGVETRSSGSGSYNTIPVDTLKDAKNYIKTKMLEELEEYYEKMKKAIKKI